MTKPNAGHFKKGYDPRRHILSKAERRKGYEIATQLTKMPSRTRAWLRKMIRGYYQTRNGTRKT